MICERAILRYTLSPFSPYLSSSLLSCRVADAIVPNIFACLPEEPIGDESGGRRIGRGGRTTTRPFHGIKRNIVAKI